MSRLEVKGFASTNVVLGIGSFTYQGAIHDGCIVTRDTHGMAVKATFGTVNGEDREIFKDPVTDDGLKKSAKGLISVLKGQNGDYFYKDQVSWEEVFDGEMDVIWRDGKFLKRRTLSEVRKNISVTQ